MSETKDRLRVLVGGEGRSELWELLRQTEASDKDAVRLALAEAYAFGVYHGQKVEGGGTTLLEVRGLMQDVSET